MLGVWRWLKGARSAMPSFASARDRHAAMPSHLRLAPIYFLRRAPLCTQFIRWIVDRFSKIILLVARAHQNTHARVLHAIGRLRFFFFLPCFDGAAPTRWARRCSLSTRRRCTGCPRRCIPTSSRGPSPAARTAEAAPAGRRAPREQAAQRPAATFMVRDIHTKDGGLVCDAVAAVLCRWTLRRGSARSMEGEGSLLSFVADS